MAKTYYLPTVAAIAVASFTLTDRRRQADEIIAVEYLDYGIMGGLQITSLTHRPLVIEKVFANNEFYPYLHALRGEGMDSFLCIGFPRRLLRFGDSFITITDAAAAADPIRLLCYGKPITGVNISTSFGDFAFEIGEILSDPLISHAKLV